MHNQSGQIPAQEEMELLELLGFRRQNQYPVFFMKTIILEFLSHTSLYLLYSSFLDIYVSLILPILYN